MVQEYVLEVTGVYVTKCLFSVFGEDRIKLFNIHEGDNLTIHFDIDAREFNGRWYNDIRAYNVTRENEQPSIAPKNITKQVSPEPLPPINDLSWIDDKELPF